MVCVLFALGEFDDKARTDVQQMLGCEVQLSRNDWYDIVFWGIRVKSRANKWTFLHLESLGNYLSCCLWMLRSKGSTFPGADIYEMVKKINSSLGSSIQNIMKS